MEYWSLFTETLRGHARWVVSEVTQPGIHNYFYWLLGLSALCAGLEAWKPWRREQKVLRHDFWLDGFYMFFNFFIFPLVGYQAAATVVEALFLRALGTESLNLVGGWPMWLHILTLFFVRDFVQWNVHRLLHRIPALWRFHRVHHSAEELGFATHLRFHPMETVVYRFFEYLPLAVLGFGVVDLFAVHIFTLAVGHLNHTNVVVPLGPLRFLLNNPQMHRWHHVINLPRAYGVNFGITLSCWDYVFGTAYVPHDGADEILGVPEQELFPTTFFGQLVEPFRRRTRRLGRPPSR